MQFERRMSDAEGLMWRLEKDPFLSSTYGTVTILDRPMDVERFKRRIARAVGNVSRLRQRVQPAPANLAAPMWVDDESFDLTYHVRRTALPQPGTVRDLLDFATTTVSEPFERTRPLWQFTIVEGLEGGRSALVQKLHHAVIDGEGGVRLSLEYLDFERDAPEPEPVAFATSGSGQAEESPLDAIRDILNAALKVPISMARSTAELLTHPARLPDATAATAESVRAMVRQLGDTDRAHSPLWTRRSLKRRLEVLRVPFEPARRAAKALGGTLNTAFLAGTAAGAGAYHRALGVDVATLRASMAISTRTAESGANAFTLSRFVVPAGDLPMRERFEEVARITSAARNESGRASLDQLAALAGLLPTSLITRVARQQSQTIDFATSNVRMSPVRCFVAGAQIVENYAIGPLGGVAFNVTLLSYHGSLDIGIHLDPAAVEEPELLRSCLDRSFADLLAEG